MSSKPASPYQLAKYGHIAARLRQELTKRDWSYDALAKEIGIVTGAAVSHWVNAQNGPSEAAQRKLAKLFGIPREDLMPRDIEGAVAVGRPVKPLPTNGGKVTILPPPPDPAEALSFVAYRNGKCRLKLDAILDIDVGAPLFSMLTASGIFTREPDGPEPDPA